MTITHIYSSCMVSKRTDEHQVHTCMDMLEGVFHHHLLYTQQHTLISMYVAKHTDGGGKIHAQLTTLLM